MKLYKFRTVDKYSLIGLLQSTLWFSNLKDFNDPFEGRYMLDDEISPEILNKLIDKINIENAVPEERDKIFKELGITDGGKDKKNLCLKMINRDFHNAYINIIHDSKALCLSYFDKTEDKPDPLYENLMWSHYADGLRGFCNVFDCDVLLNNLTKLKIRPALVQYLDKPLILKIDSYAEHYVLKNDFSKAISEAVPTISSKSLKWIYEGEIRLLSTEKKNLISYPSNALIEIVIGEKMPVDEQKQIILNARTANPAVIIKTARLKPDTYQLEIIDYIKPKNN